MNGRSALVSAFVWCEEILEEFGGPEPLFWIPYFDEQRRTVEHTA
jgi:hypothetical protein